MENLTEIKNELILIDKAESKRTLQGQKQYVGRFINKYENENGRPSKMDMSDEAGLFWYAIAVYKSLHI